MKPPRLLLGVGGGGGPTSPGAWRSGRRTNSTGLQAYFGIVLASPHGYLLSIYGQRALQAGLQGPCSFKNIKAELGTQCCPKDSSSSGAGKL